MVKHLNTTIFNIHGSLLLIWMLLQSIYHQSSLNETTSNGKNTLAGTCFKKKKQYSYFLFSYPQSHLHNFNKLFPKNKISKTFFFLLFLLYQKILNFCIYLKSKHFYNSIPKENTLERLQWGRHPPSPFRCLCQKPLCPSAYFNKTLLHTHTEHRLTTATLLWYNAPYYPEYKIYQNRVV